MIVFPRCAKCDHESRVHTGDGCSKCTCAASPREIMETRLMLAETDLSSTMALVATLKFRLDALEEATRAYGIIA